MKRRGLIASLFGIILIAVLALGATVVTGRSPLLGLDLRGGVSVVLQPYGKVTTGTLQTAVGIIDNRVNGLGVSNSTVQRQGNDILIELPGSKNADQILSLLETPARLFFRPVDCQVGGYVAPKAGSTPTTTTTLPASKQTATTDLDASLAKQCSAASGGSSIPSSSVAQPNYQYDTIIVPASSDSGYGKGVRFILGPADLTGSAIKTASAEVSQGTTNQYVVNMTLTGKGLAGFNKVAAIRNRYYSGSASTQPYQALEAFELDGQVESAPSIEESVFTGSVQISGDFTSAQASHLALELRYGGLPVAFKFGNVETVSALLGHDSLQAGLYAGLGGILLVLLYMIAYYRGLGLVVVLGLAVGGAILYAILTQLSRTSGLALTLPGVTGIIVSIGITVDSYVVYFERLKDEVRKGSTIRSSVERGFTRAFRTVLTADLVSFLAALILYLFTVGDVRGFAFTLGLSTVLDVFTAYFFIRPIVVLLGRRRTTSETSFLGIARGLGAATPPVPGTA